MQPIRTRQLRKKHPAPPAAETSRYPVLGIAGACIGTLLAIALIPRDPSPKGALFLAGLVMAAGLALAPFLAMIRDPKSIVRGEHLLVLAPIYWLLLDLIQMAYDLDGVGRTETIRSFVAIGLFVCALWIGSWPRPWRLPGFIERTAQFEVTAGSLFGFILLSFALGIFKYAYACGFNVAEMFSYLGRNRWSGPWQRGALGGWDAFLDHMAYFGYLLPALTVVMANKSGWRNPRTIISIALTVIMVLFLMQGGGRRIIGAVFGMALILWVLSQRRMGPHKLAILTACAGALLVLMQFMLEYRNSGMATAFESEEGAIPDLGFAERGYVHVDDNFYRLAQTIDLIPARYPYTGIQYFIYVLVRPIPRVFWPGKPTDPGFDLADTVGQAGVSLSSSVVGDLYMSGGLLVVLLGGWLYGRLARIGDQFLAANTSGARIMYGAWTMALFVGVRSMLDLVLISYVVLAWVGMVWLAAVVAPNTFQFRTTRRQRTTRRPAVTRQS